MKSSLHSILRMDPLLPAVDRIAVVDIHLDTLLRYLLWLYHIRFGGLLGDLLLVLLHALLDLLWVRWLSALSRGEWVEQT
jgi:hypothetical protein